MRGPGDGPTPRGWIDRLRWLIEALRKREDGDGGIAAHLVSSAAGTAGLRVVATGLAFVTSVVLARLLGPSGYGVYAYVIALLYLLSIPASMGMSKLLIRNVSAYRARSEPGLTAGLLERSDQLVVAASIAVALIAYAASAGLSGDPTSTKTRCFWIVLPALPLLVLARTKQSALQGLNRVVLGQLAENIVLPGFFLLLVGVWWVAPRTELEPSTTVGLYVVSTGFALGTALHLLRKHLPSEVADSEAEYDTRQWMRSAVPLFLVAGLHVINSRTDVVMLGALADPESVGIYNVAARGAEFVVFFLSAAERAFGPTVASLYEYDAKEKLQRLVTTLAQGVFLLSIPVAASFIFFGDWILDFVYGPSYAEGHLALAILSGANLVAIALGAVSLLLIMTGHEREAAIGVGISAILNVVLNAVLIPFFGIAGAAVATGTSLVLWNIGFAIVAYRRVGLNPTAIRFRVG